MEAHVGVRRETWCSVELHVGVTRHFGVPVIIEVLIHTVDSVAILDRSRTIKALLPGVSWHYTRRINQATEVGVSIPRTVIEDHVPAGHSLHDFFNTQSKLRHAEIASYIQIYKGGRLKASGKITDRELGQVVQVMGYTEEILLENNVTPAQYGMVWDGWDLADLARDLLDGWQSLRVKAQSQWQDRIVASSNVDLATNPGHIMLAKRSNGRYFENGYVVLLFNKSEITNFKSWDRVRWSADSEDPVKTSIQISTNGVSFSAPFDGGIPEEVGYYIGGDRDQVWVRINLETTDTESEDPEGNPVGVTPWVFAVELIARTHGELVVGNIPNTAGVTVKGLSADYANGLSVLTAACEQVGWEFTVWGGALNLAESLGFDRTRDFVLRSGTNMEIVNLGDGDGELVNILTAYGPGRGINRMEVTLRDEASIQEYGPYPLAMEFDAVTLPELQTKAQQFLGEHNSPLTSFGVTATFDREREPDYGLGDKVRVADPETGIVTTTRIMAESLEYGESGLVVNLELGKANFKLSDIIGGKDSPKKPVDPLQPTGVYARGIIAGVMVGFAEPKIDWKDTEVHLSTASGFIPSASTLKDKGRQTRFDIMELTPGVRYYAKVVHVDSAGRRSEPSQEVSAVANYMPPELLPDYSLGVEKFMENLKPPIMVTSLPSLPDPRYTIGTSVFLTTDKKLYSTDGNTWEPVGAGTVTADEVVAGILTAGGIKADWYADIRNVLPYTGQDSLDSGKPIVIPFYIPSETTKIVAAFLSAEARRYRAYSKSAPYTEHSWWDKRTGKVATFGETPVTVALQTTSASGTTGNQTLRHRHYEPGSSINIMTGNVKDEEYGMTNLGHNHSFNYTRASGVQLNNFNDHKHELDPSHAHDLEFGIHEDTTPASVRMRVHNGTSWSSYITLASAPSGNAAYDLISGASVPKHNNNASEMDLTSYLSGTGWKHIEFSSSRLGLIAWNVILKLDITA